jgi:hypothetical protein
MGSARIRRAPVTAPLLAVLVVAAFVAYGATGHAQIREPGAHPQYSVEVEPHFVLSWSNHFWGGDGIGAGARVSIPVVDNGPVTTINDNLAIGFGFDWSHYDGPCWNWGPWAPPGPPGPPGPRPDNWWRYDCAGNSFSFPAVVQWNFFFTKAVGAFAEAGLAIEYSTWNATYPCGGGLCRPSAHELDVDPLFFAGGRFLLSDSFGFVVRLGWPYLSVGVTLLL